MRPAADVPVVNRFEADLLTILQGFLGHVPASQLLPLLARPLVRPKCLSRTAVALVQDTLATGATLWAARGGWRQERFLRAGAVVSGRVWERSGPATLGLEFSEQSLDFLMWATAAAGSKADGPWTPIRGRTLALGDRWLLTAAYQAVRGSEVGARWLPLETWRNEPLCQLLFAADFEQPAKAPALDFSPWFKPAGIAVLEAGLEILAKRWVEMERDKGRVTSPQRLRSMAASQSRALDAWLEACDQAGRRDLSRFLLAAFSRLLTAGATLQNWTGNLQGTDLRLADRQQAQRDALCAVERFAHLARWQAQARSVVFFDDEYQAAQLWKSDWEAYNGDGLALAAQRLLDQAQWL